jgi:hypothetical protein
MTETPDPLTGPEGTGCPTCGNLIRRFPDTYGGLGRAREALVKLAQLVDKLNTEDEASFSYAFDLHGRRLDGTYWPETMDDDYYVIASLASQIGEAMAQVRESAVWVQATIAADTDGQYPPKTMRFPLGVRRDEAEALLHPEVTP